MDEALAPGADRYRPVFLHSAKEVLEVLLRPASGISVFYSYKYLSFEVVGGTAHHTPYIQIDGVGEIAFGQSATATINAVRDLDYLAKIMGR